MGLALVYVHKCIDTTQPIALAFATVLFEWDATKNRRNKQKHKISFELASEVFFDPFCLTIPDESSASEERYWTLGRIPDSLTLVVVHTFSYRSGEEIVRIISARKATPRERRFYEESGW